MKVVKKFIYRSDKMIKKVLVAYFSCSGATETLAHQISTIIGADEYKIEPKIPYTYADLNWLDKNSRSTIEMHNLLFRPEILDKCKHMDEYEIIFLGFPIWWYQAPTIIHTFLESYDFSNKTIIPFCTSGGSGAGKTDEILHNLCSHSVHWYPCQLLKCNANDKDILSWIKDLTL